MARLHPGRHVTTGGFIRRPSLTCVPAYCLPWSGHLATERGRERGGGGGERRQRESEGAIYTHVLV